MAKSPAATSISRLRCSNASCGCVSAKIDTRPSQIEVVVGHDLRRIVPSGLIEVRERHLGREITGETGRLRMR